MKNRPSYEDLENRIKELEKKTNQKSFSDKLPHTLFDISYAANTTHDLNQFYQSIYDSLNRLMKLPNFFIAVFNEKKNTIHFPFYIDEQDDGTYQNTFFSDGNSLTSEVISKRKPLYLDEKELRKRDDENKVVGPLPKIWIGVPLMIKKKVIGVVAIQNYTDPDYFTKEDIDILASASNHIALAIERKQS
ncbi:MAG: GAF domain-containing protein [Desulfobacula sp.]|nr:GAF domain-containing protein [Desulfobacula sp.]